MNRIFIITSVIVLLTIAIASVAVLFVRRSESTPSVPASGAAQTGAPGGAGPGFAGDTADVISAPLPPARPSREVAIANTARMFAELYGSYSTEMPFANLRVSLPYMTARFRAESERTLAAPVKPAKEFYQILTRAQSAEITKDSPDRVVVIVGTSREEERGSGQPRMFTQKLELTLVQEGESWKVDKAVWR